MAETRKFHAVHPGAILKEELEARHQRGAFCAPSSGPAATHPGNRPVQTRHHAGNGAPDRHRALHRRADLARHATGLRPAQVETELGARVRAEVLPAV